MSTNFHANQYEQAFTPNRIQNWEVPKNHEGKYPASRQGFTRIKANDRGHLLPNVPRERSSPWGTFVGTWDMPTKIPGNSVVNPTARSDAAILKGQKTKEKGEIVLSGALKRCRTTEPLPVKMDAPETELPPGVTTEAITTSMQPCGPGEATLGDFNQSRGDSRDSLKWPKARSPVGNPQSPKPVTPMCVAENDVQDMAKQRVSPLAPKNNNAVIGALNTPDADLQQRAGKPPTPQDRIVGMKSPPNPPVDGSNPQAEAALVS